MTRKMKDSGIKWIGEIPEDWEVVKVKDAFYRKNIKANTNNPVVLSLARNGVKIRDISNNEGQLAADYSNYNPVEIDDLLLNPMDLVSGDNCNISKVNGVISPAYINLRYKKGTNPELYNYYFKNLYWGNVFFAHGKGVSYENRWTLNYETFSQMKIPYPPANEQNRIAKFLNGKLNKLEDIKNTLNKEIENLENYKKSVITEAVTKGLDKNVEMKESGIEWIGEIPKHWDLKTIKSLTIKSERGTSPSYVDDNTQAKVVNQATFSQGFFDKTNIKFSKIPASQSKGLLQKKDVLIASTGGGVLGKTYYFIENDEYVADGHITILRTDPSIQHSKILYYILSVNYELINGLLAKGSTNQTELQSEWLKNFKLPYAPIDEQNRIVAYLDGKCKLIDESISIKQKQLETLEEYKKSLIYEYVTGKKEVELG